MQMAVSCLRVYGYTGVRVTVGGGVGCGHCGGLVDVGDWG